MNQSIASWDRQSKDPFIKFNIKRSTFIAFAISLAIHGAVLFATRNQVVATATLPKPLTIRILGIPAKTQQQVITPKKIMTRKKVVKAKRPIPPVTIVKAEAPLPLPLPAEKNAPTDLMSFIKEKRRIAQELEDNAAFNNPSAHQPSAEERRDAIIKRNLQQTGTNGIFEIRRKSFSRGQFSFRGWKQNYSNSRLELIDVEAGADNNIDLAIVKKMIEIIRREYQGDFRWDSARLGRMVVLSARMQDNARLEAFLMQEFFTAE